MSTYTFDDLVQSLEGRRRLGEEPPVLLLGAGASASAGLATMRRLYEAEGIAPDAPDAFDEFCVRMRKRDDRERFRWLAAHLQRADAQDVTTGYRALAALCAQHIFDVVLTANLDPLLEDAFSATSLRRRDYLVLVNGVLRTERLPLLMLPGAPRVKVLKLHGDLFHRFMAWTPEEMDVYLRDITPTLAKSLAMRDVLVVGYSLRDPAVRELALGTGGSVWFANPRPPAAEVAALLAARQVRVITSPECEFETFFSGLASALSVPFDTSAEPVAPKAPVASSPVRRGLLRGRMAQGPAGVARSKTTPVEVARNLDEVQAATVGVLVGDDPGVVGFTGFVLAEPRVIVTDGWNLAQMPGPRGGEVRIITQSGERLRAKRAGVVNGNAFGPALLEAPDALRVAGLGLDVTPWKGRDSIDVAVGTNLRRAIMEGAMSVDQALEQHLIDETLAEQIREELRVRAAAGAAAADAAWQRFALAHGSVRTGTLESLEIAPLGEVGQMVQLDLATSPGSSGAAVVDASCAVRGFIVAGSIDPKQPQSYALPASWWGPRLTRALASQ